jgi:hypothetical protein
MQACIALHSGINNTIALYTRLNQESLVPKPLMRPPLLEPSCIHIKGSQHMGSFLERLHVELVPGLYSRKRCGPPSKGLCVPPEGGPTLLDGDLASDII